MKILLAILLLASSLTAQVATSCGSVYVGTRDPIVRVLGCSSGFDETDFTALYTFGPRLDLNPTATTFDAPVNLLPCSEDMTCAGWTSYAATVNSAVLVTFTGQFGEVYRPVLTAQGVNYTLFFTCRNISGNTALRYRHTGSATGDSTAFTITGTTADYAVSVLGKTGGGNINFGLYDTNGAGQGQIEVTRWAVYPGTYTAEQAAAIYEKTAANWESITDWSGNGNTLCNGGNCSTTSTNSASNSVASYNLAAAGSVGFAAGWTLSPTVHATPNSGDVVDPDGGNSAAKIVFDASATTRSIYQSVGSSDSNVYVSSVYLRTASGSEDIRLYGNISDENDVLNITVTTTWTRFSVVKDQTSTIPGMILRRMNTQADAATVYAYHPQFELVPTGTTTPLPYQDSAEPVFQCASCSFATDDYLTMDSLASQFAGADKPITVLSLIRLDDILSKHTVFGIGLSSSATPVFEFLVNTSGQLEIARRDDFSSLVTLSTVQTVATGLWHIAAMSFAGAEATLYLNGSATSVTDSVMDVGAITLDRATIGALRRNTTSNYFNGQIPLVLIEDRALSSRELIGNGSCSSASTASESRLLRQCGLMGLIAWEYWNKRAIPITGYRELGFYANAPTGLPTYYTVATPWDSLDEMRDRWIDVMWARLLPIPGGME